MTDVTTLRRVLTQHQRVAVVGLSADPTRPSHAASKYLLNRGFDVTPVNPKYEKVLGRPCYPSLSAIPHPIEVVNLFQRSENVVPFVEEAIAIGAKAVWMQLGVVNEEAAARARGAGLEVIMDRCMKVEYARLVCGDGGSETDTDCGARDP